MNKMIVALGAVLVLGMAAARDIQAQTQPKSAAPATAGAHKAGEFIIEPATTVLSGTEKLDYEIGTMYVPENRSDPASRVIGIGFARIKAAEPTDAPPTFHLPGGPGSSYLTDPRKINPHILRYRAAGDVVIVDQRGFSPRGETLRYAYRTPDEPLDEPANMARAATNFLKLAREVVDHYAKKGVDLRGYTVKECAEDVNDVRKALGYRKINLMGVSYGSQWSFAIMRLHPEIVARALLSGVEPLNNGYDMPSGILADMQRSWTEAQKAVALEPYIPPGGLEAAANAILKRLEGGPVKVQVKDPKGEQMVTVTLGKEDFQQGMMAKTADCPAFILSLYYEHYDAWAQVAIEKRRSHQTDLRVIGPLIDTSLGVTPEREKQLRSDPAVAYLGQWNWNAYIASADIWPTADMGDDFRTPVQTPIPVLFMHGDWDASTPLINSLDIAKSFPKGRVVIIERGGHVTMEQFAVRYPREFSQVLDFLRTGDMPNLPERMPLPASKFTVPDFPPPGTQPASKAANKD